MSVALTAGEAVERRVGEDKGELKFGNCFAKVLEGNGGSRRDLRERLAEELTIRGSRSAGAVLRGECRRGHQEGESGHLDTLRRRDEGLGYEQVRQVGEGELSGGGNWKPALLSNGSPESAAKREFHIRVGYSAVLTASGVRRRCAARPMGANDEIVVDADRHRLRVLEAVRRRVATGAGVVIIQAADEVKPEQVPRLARCRSIGRPSLETWPRFFSREAGPCEDLASQWSSPWSVGP